MDIKLPKTAGSIEWTAKAMPSCWTAPEVDKLKAMPDFEGREEPAVAEDFLRFRAEGWADVLSSAGAEPGEIAVTIDPHQKKAHLTQGDSGS